ncbi:MAG TPA: iron-sulfur cluster assembly accessory protein [Thiolapillus brandeum]|uniref:Iron-sulfur cluster assembly accessory protein n=1 Tax=Thiolapillus brandeum TaxID=1076588 RepID=A0A7C5N9Q4_9GAMM|nr:iron-sulfur cluster assembly accessory protein [Thiolapillus brandeum]
MSIQLTESAAKHIAKELVKKPEALGFRLGTKKAGCTGFAYVVDYATEITDNDEVFESRGIKIVVDRDSLPMLEGLEVDFVTTNLLNQGFDFHNPNVKETCGCGESFNV